MKKIRKELWDEFEKYYADLKKEAKENGYRANKAYEWERFVEQYEESLKESI